MICFDCLIVLEVFQRDRMLTGMYLAFLEAPVTQETAETEEERLELRYNKFEQKFRHAAISPDYSPDHRISSKHTRMKA